ncbi:MAG: class II aldolase/adducin family protein [Anaerovoracaceae bacterium]
MYENMQKIKESIIRAGLKLMESGLIVRTWGNVSCRIDDNWFAITPSGKAYESLKADDIVLCRIKDASYTGSTRPSSEKGIHALIYRNRPEAKFIIHTHQKYASVASVCGIGDKAEFKGIPLSSYAPPGSRKLIMQIAKVLPFSEGSILMAHHGALCFGSNADEVFENAHELEKTCLNYIKKIYLGISHATNFDLSEMKDFYYTNYPQRRRFVRPMLDDFAQIAGVFVKSYHKINALKAEDKPALHTIFEKNELAEICATLTDNYNPIPLLDCFIMRRYYLKSYSKRK